MIGDVPSSPCDQSILAVEPSTDVRATNGAEGTVPPTIDVVRGALRGPVPASFVASIVK